MHITARQQPPPKRRGTTDKIHVNGPGGTWTLFIRISWDELEMPCEIFIDTGKEGTMVRNLLASFAMMMSLALQHGATLAEAIHTLRAFREDPIINAIIHFLNTYHLPEQLYEAEVAHR